MKKKWLAGMAAMAVLTCALSGCVKVVPIGGEGALTGESAFSAGDNVAEFWETLALPELTAEAVDLATLLNEANGDLSSVAETYGHYSMGDSGELSFAVSGTATVEEVNRDGSAGYLLLSVPDAPHDYVIKMQIGSVYKGTAIRDTLSFVSYDNYTNQVEWAEVSQSIHKLVDEQVIQAANVDSLQGKTIAFTACFTSNQNNVLLTPVILTVQ